jgi:hypothetical protein
LHKDKKGFTIYGLQFTIYNFSPLPNPPPFRGGDRIMARIKILP